MKDTEAKKGMKFNYLTMISDSYVKNRRRYAIFKCVCGKEKELRVSNVIDIKGTKSCGCMRYQLMSETQNHYKHGLCHSRICQIWYRMKNRCGNSNYPEFYLYGGRGIKVCDEWKNDFMAFYKWAMEHGYSDDLSIDRIDVNGNYEPSNCRWATNKEQCNNTRRNIFLTVGDETKTLKQWCDELNITYELARRRYHNGKTVNEILLL